MIDLTSMDLDELIFLREEVIKEITNRVRPSQLALYTHGCKDASKYHLNKYKHWAKLISGVNASKTNGYAFQGDFLSVTREHKLPVGSVVVEVCDTAAFACRLTAVGVQVIAKGSTKSMSAFIEAVARELSV